MNKNVSVCIDFLTFTLRGFDDYREAINLLGLNPDLFDHRGSCLSGYRDGCVYDNIHICYDARENKDFGDMGIAVSMSGKGCRRFENCTTLQDGFTGLLKKLHSMGDQANVTRVDLAADDHIGLLNMETIAQHVDRRVDFYDIRSRSQKRSIDISWDVECLSGLTVYIGSKSSDFFIRFYDKAREQVVKSNTKLSKDSLTNIDYWTRCECVLKHKNANAFVSLFVNCEDIGTIFTAILNDKIAFIERDDSNISRCSICDWWLNFVDSLKSVHLITRVDIPHSVDDSFEWLRWQVAPMLAVIKKTRGFADFLRLIDEGEQRLTAKHEALIKDYINAKLS